MLPTYFTPVCRKMKLLGGEVTHFSYIDEEPIGIDTLELDKLLGDGPELLGMVCVQSIRHIAGEG